jgi:hypothetical protein
MREVVPEHDSNQADWIDSYRSWNWTQIHCSNRPADRGLDPRMGIHGSDPTIGRVLDPTRDISTEDRFRFLVGCLGQLNAVALSLAQRHDGLRAEMAEPSGRN